MRSLAQTSGVGGVEAMQEINREVFRWIFMTLFIGMAPVSLAVASYGWFVVGGGPGFLMTLAGATYVIGCFGVTVAFNVPLNETLAGMNVSETATHRYWSDVYLPRWVYWNSVRTGASIASSALLLFGLLWMTQAQARIA